MAIYDANDNILMRFIYVDSRLPVAMQSNGATYYLAYDQVGSLRIITDATGNVIKALDYDSFGNIIQDTNPSFDMPFGFAAGLYDPDTGLVRFGFREYSPEIGRWTAKDPFLFLGGDTDLYGYCLNDPIDWKDPLGLETEPESPSYWKYSQSTGRLTFIMPDGVEINYGQGYSGNQICVNQPACQGIQDLGPLPQGWYIIGAGTQNSLGPVSMPLTPTVGNVMRGRFGFWIHSDNACQCQNASTGCIVFDLPTLNAINNSTNRYLLVTY